MTTVFVTTENPTLDYSPAYQFGENIVAVFPPGQVHLNPQVAIYRARGVLKAMQPGDYLALVGDPLKIGVCMTVAAERLGKFNTLKWNRQSLSYLAIPVDFTTREAMLTEEEL